MQKLPEIYPLKFIHSEVTPRMDHLDRRVKEVNELLSQYAMGNDQIFLVRNSNLRNPDNYFTDGKHLKHAIIPRFASNIKRALRSAYGIKFDRSYYNRRSDQEFTYSNHQRQQQQEDQQQSQQQQQQRQQQQPRQQQTFDLSNQPLLQMIQKELINQISRAFEHVGT